MHDPLYEVSMGTFTIQTAAVLQPIYYLIYVRVPVLVVLGLGGRAVDPGEEGGLGEVHVSLLQTKHLRNDCLDPLTYISKGWTTQTTGQRFHEEIYMLYIRVLQG